MVLLALLILEKFRRREKPNPRTCAVGVYSSVGKLLEVVGEIKMAWLKRQSKEGLAWGDAENVLPSQELCVFALRCRGL
jgi:hypothetical protein